MMRTEHASFRYSGCDRRRESIEGLEADGRSVSSNLRYHKYPKGRRVVNKRHIGNGFDHAELPSSFVFVAVAVVAARSGRAGHSGFRAGLAMRPDACRPTR